MINYHYTVFTLWTVCLKFSCVCTVYQIMCHCSVFLDDGAQVYIRASGFWTTPQLWCLCFVAFNHSITLAVTFCKHEAENAILIKSMLMRWCMAVSPLWYSPHLVVWGRQPPSLINALPACQVRSGVTVYGLALSIPVWSSPSSTH